MRSTKVWAWGLAGVGAAVVCSASVRGEFLPIVNPGFETLNVTLRPGEQTNGAGGVPMNSGLPETPVNTRWQSPFNSNGNTPQTGVIVPGWRTVPGAPGSLAGVLNPAVNFSGNAWMTGFSGNHVGVAQAAFMQQTLNVQVQPSTTYTLTFLAGIGITDSEYTPLLQLLAAPDLTTFATPSTSGVVSLARVPGESIIRRAQFGAMIPFSISYTSPDVLPADLAGKYLAISFLGSDGIPRVVYDDFRLEAVPGPSCGLMVLGACGVWMRRRRVSRGVVE
jgi:hypothetical protein